MLKSPWNPSQIGWICVLFGAFPGVWLWVVNNRRLGLAPPRITRVFVWASLVVYTMILARLLLTSPDAPLSLRFRVLSVIMTIIIAWQLFVSQRVSFAHYRRQGGQMASVWTPLWVGIVGAMLLVGFSWGIETVRWERESRDFDRAVAWMEQGPGPMRQAEIFFQNSKTQYPQEPMTHWNLAVIYSRTNRIERAKIELREMLKLEPENKNARDFLRELEDY